MKHFSSNFTDKNVTLQDSLIFISKQSRVNFGRISCGKLGESLMFLLSFYRDTEIKFLFI